MAKFPTFKSSWPWPWIGSYCIPSCITHRRLLTYQISLKSKKLFVDGRTYVRTDVRTSGRTFDHCSYASLRHSILHHPHLDKKLWQLQLKCTKTHNKWTISWNFIKVIGNGQTKKIKQWGDDTEAPKVPRLRRRVLHKGPQPQWWWKSAPSPGNSSTGYWQKKTLSYHAAMFA